MNRKMKIFLLGMLAVLLALMMVACGDSEKSDNSSDSASSSKSSIGKFSENSSWSELGLDYDKFARNPEDNEGEKVAFIGKVFNPDANLIYIGDAEQELILKSGNRNSEDWVFVLYVASEYPQRFLENDIVKVTGTFLEATNNLPSTTLVFVAEDIVLQ